MCHSCVIMFHDSVLQKHDNTLNCILHCCILNRTSQSYGKKYLRDTKISELSEKFLLLHVWETVIFFSTNQVLKEVSLIIYWAIELNKYTSLHTLYVLIRNQEVLLGSIGNEYIVGYSAVSLHSSVHE